MTEASKAIAETQPPQTQEPGSRPASAGAHGSRYRWVILAVGVIAQLGASSTGQGIPALGYFLQGEWSLSKAEVGMFASAAYAISALSGGAFGLIIDIVGIRLLLLLAMVSAGSLVTVVAFSNSFLMALLVLLAVGLATSGINPAIAKALMYWFPARTRATAMGIKQSGVPLSGALVAAILPWLAITFNWRVAVFAMGVAIIGCGILSFALYREVPQTAKRASNVQRPTLRRISQVMTRRDILTLIALQLPLSAANFAVVSYLLLYLNEVMFFPLVLAAMLLSLAQFSGSAGRILWGIASDRLFGGNRRNTMLVIVAGETAFLVAIAALPVGTSGWVFTMMAILLGVLVFGYPGVYMAHVGEIASKDLVGTVFGFVFATGQLGIVFGPPLFGYVVDQTGSYRWAWMMIAAGVAVSGALLLTVREGHRQDTVYE